jgi:flagellar hook-associated protein 2
MDVMRTSTTQKPVASPAGTSDAAKGALYADPTLQGVMDALRSTLGSAFTGVGNTSSFNLLSQIGISTGATTGGATFNPDAVAGKLTLDKTVLSAALDKDPSSVQRLLGGASSSTSGLSQAVSAALDPYTQTDGIIDQRVTSSDNEQRDITQQLADFDARIALRQTFLQNQFTALETALQSLQAQSTSLASSLNGLSSRSN